MKRHRVRDDICRLAFVSILFGYNISEMYNSLVFGCFGTLPTITVYGAMGSVLAGCAYVFFSDTIEHACQEEKQ